MIYKNTYKYFLIIVILLITSGNVIKSQDNEKKKKKKNNKSELSEKQKFEFESAYFDANKHMVFGNYELAKGIFLECLKLKENDAATLYNLSTICSFEKKFEEAITYAKAAVKSNNNNIWYSILLGNLYLKTEKYNEAIKLFEGLIKKFPNEIDLYIDLIEIYKINNNPEKAIETLEKLEKILGINDMISLEKEQIYLRDGKEEKARNEILKLINAFPNESKYYGILVESYMDSKMYDEAYKTMEKILEIDPNNGLVHISLAEYYRKNKNYEKSFEELKIAFKNRNISADVKINMIVSVSGISDNYIQFKEKINELIYILLEMYPEDRNVRIVYTDLLIESKKFREAKENLQFITEEIKNNYLIWEQLLFIENQLGDFDDLYSESNKAIKYFPNQPMIYLFKGLAAYSLNKYEQAIEPLEFGRKLIVNDDPLKIQFYTYLAESYYRMDSLKKSFLIFDEILEFEPENLYILNNYSYYLSLENDSLLKAKKMSLITIEKEPLNYTYLDTYAWILYKLEMYDEAQKIIERSILNGGSKNPTIIEHYGDILFKKLMNDEAIIQWNKAKDLGSTSKNLENKIKEKSLIE
ncbi:MAG: tetratricopeptide repeat protein [Bacteroidales bacterium]|nr:tetratricopeptide repeat protein [Bacteroidales bacterium]